MDTLQKQTRQAIQSGTVDWTGYIQKGTQIIQDFQSAILPYIGTGKLDIFSVFIQGRLKLLQANTLIKTHTANLKKEIEDTTKEMKQQIEQKKKELEQKLEQAKKDKELKLEQKKKELELQKEQKKKELEQKKKELEQAKKLAPTKKPAPSKK
jgi:C4-dicarboxylate-specific signal transduction histidine kinase